MKTRVLCWEQALSPRFERLSKFLEQFIAEFVSSLTFTMKRGLSLCDKFTFTQFRFCIRTSREALVLVGM